MGDEAKYGLGLDQGVASIGWAVLRLNSDNQPIGIERLGVHIFEAGTEGDIEGGRDESRAGPRRMARQLRKQYRRRVLRKKRLLRWLQEMGLMPAGDISSAEGRDKLIKDLDKQLREKWEPAASTDHRTRQLLPYRIRAAGLTQRLEPFELGRALYHLAQRRGYLSNRKQQAAEASQGDGAEEKKSDEGGEVRASIIELEKQMQGANCKTLAQYFSTLDPTGAIGDRLRGRWTAREMFLEEFGRICSEQAKHHTVLTDEARHRLHRAIFFQRPLQSASHLIGKCELVPGKRRCPLGHRLAQRFRMLQRVNDLEIRLPDFTRRRLSKDERDRLIDSLQQDGDITFAKLKSKAWFGLPKGSTFNLEEGGEKKLIGNRTEAKCRLVFGEKAWSDLPDTDRDAVVQDLLVFEKPAALAGRGVKRWKLSAEQANQLGDCVLEPGFAAHCKEALAILLTRMEEGTPYATAVKEEFRIHKAADEIHVLLPPVEKALGALRNPTVTRALTELRKLVNAVVRKYGKPQWIRLELARDLKRARKHRERMGKEMRAQEERRDFARARVLKDAGIAQISRADIERVLLAEECGWVCPYTGKAFGMHDVVGRHPQVDVEHIWPLSRSLDDSYLNKTLCYVEENRNFKKNRTPFEAYSRSSERWAQMIDRVKRFRSDAGRIKLERFLAEEIPEGFAQRHLSETRKIGAASSAYLGLLYGGEIDANHNRRVFATTGGLTAHLRREWHLHGILSDDGEKTREDHRHHAVDALVIALTDTKAVQSLQSAAEHASASGRRLFAPVDEPWPEFVNQAQEHVLAINVSHRQNRRLAGKLHAESNYSRPTGQDGDRRIRKEVSKLTEKEVERIVDPKIKAAVIAKLAELKGPPNKVFFDRANHPYTVTKSGRHNPIHKVRIVVNERPWAVGRFSTERFVSSTAGSNHHTVISKGSNGKWSDFPVSLIDIQRSASFEKRPHAGSITTLAAGEFVLMKDKAGAEQLFRVLSVSEGDIELIPHLDARMSTDRKKDRTRGNAASLIKRGLKKVSVTYLGEIRRAGG